MRVKMLFDGDAGGSGVDAASPPRRRSAVALVHNLGEEYVLHLLSTSPLLRCYKQPSGDGVDGPGKNVLLVFLAHNPETLAAAHLMSNHGQANDPSSSLTLVAPRPRCNFGLRRRSEVFRDV